MTLVVVKSKKVLSISHLWLAVLKFVYDQANMSALEVREMQESIINWANAIEFEKEKLAQIQAADIRLFGRKITSEHKYSEEEYQLELMAKLLKENESGELDGRKATFKEHGIDYKKFHRVPGAVTQEDMEKGKKLLKESNRREGIE